MSDFLTKLHSLFVGVNLLTVIPAWVALILSTWNLWKGRLSLRIYVGCEQYDNIIYIYNNSQFEITISSAGLICSNGCLMEFSDLEGDGNGIRALPLRIKARDEGKLFVAISAIESQNKFIITNGYYIRTSNNKIYSDIYLLRRWWWCLKSLLKIV